MPIYSRLDGSVIRFYRTYEELKHHREYVHRRDEQSFYRTYEELKLRHLCKFLRDPYAFLSYL